MGTVFLQRSTRLTKSRTCLLRGGRNQVGAVLAGRLATAVAAAVTLVMLFISNHLPFTVFLQRSKSLTKSRSSSLRGGRNQVSAVLAVSLERAVAARKST